MGSNIFYDGLLPSVSDDKNVDYVSGLGFALGYLGGGILFALNVFMVQEPAFFAASFVVCRRKKGERSRKTILLIQGYLRLKKTLQRVTSLKGLFLFLVAYCAVCRFSRHAYSRKTRRYLGYEKSYISLYRCLYCYYYLCVPDGRCL